MKHDGGVVVAPAAVAEGRLQWNRAAARLAGNRPIPHGRQPLQQPPGGVSVRPDDRLPAILFNLPQEGQFADLRTHVLMAVIRGSGASPGRSEPLQLDEIDCDAQGRLASASCMYWRSVAAPATSTSSGGPRAASTQLLARIQPLTERGGRPERGFPVVQTRATPNRCATSSQPLPSRRAIRSGDRCRHGDTCRARAATQTGIRAEGSITQMPGVRSLRPPCARGKRQEVVERMVTTTCAAVPRLCRDCVHGTHGAEVVVSACQALLQTTHSQACYPERFQGKKQCAVSRVGQ